MLFFPSFSRLERRADRKSPAVAAATPLTIAEINGPKFVLELERASAPLSLLQELASQRRGSSGEHAAPERAQVLGILAP